MAIKYGGGLGMPIGRQGTNVRKPVENQFPVPVEAQLRLGVFELQEEREDYLICKGYDPNAFNGVLKTIKVAKPWLLQKTRWDGQTVPLYVGGELVDVTFEYTGLGKRIARAIVVTTNSDGEEEEEEVEETQRITMDYFAGDSIVAVQVRHDSFREGVNMEGDAPRRLWMDLNMSGRCWAVSEEEGE